MLLPSMWRNPVHFLACGFGLGAMPIMPGTFGTGLGVLVYLMLASFSLPIYLLITCMLLIAGIYLCGRTCRDVGLDDHSAVVWDEMASFPLVMMAIPVTWYYVLAGFVLFRVLDVAKPWPIRWVDEQVRGGFGIMLDDILAALGAWALLYLATLL